MHFPVSGGSDGCGDNEEYLTCGSACPPTCSDPGPQICTEQCVEGCFCVEGYLLRGNKCVHHTQCH